MTSSAPTPAGEAGSGAGAYPMTSLQGGMVYHAELGARPCAYHSLLTVTVRGHRQHPDPDRGPMR